MKTNLRTEQSERSAKRVGFVYVHDDRGGIRRIRHGKGFSYLHANGRRVLNEAVLARIRDLVIPPACNTVSICRKCYVHPEVIDSYLDGSLAERLSKLAGAALARGKLPASEAAVLGLLQNRLARARPHKKRPA